MFIIILLVGIICKNSYNNKKVKKKDLNIFFKGIFIFLFYIKRNIYLKCI